MEPEKKSLEKEILLETILFRLHVKFRGVKIQNMNSVSISVDRIESCMMKFSKTSLLAANHRHQNWSSSMLSSMECSLTKGDPLSIHINPKSDKLSIFFWMKKNQSLNVNWNIFFSLFLTGQSGARLCKQII